MLARAPVVVVVVVAMGGAILGIGMGSSPAEAEPGPGALALAAARARIASGGRRGRELFAEEGCDRCHSIAAIGAGGKLGPRLDTLDAELDDNLESIAEPRHDIVEGYPEKLMPADFAQRLSDADLRALAAFVTAASGGKQASGKGTGGGDGGGTGRDRGRGRGGCGHG